MKLLGGPFVNCDEVDQYISDQSISDKVKQDRLYTEVQYARDTTLSLPRDSKLFSLKEKGKNPPLNRYVTNLKVYLSKVSSASATTWDDFDGAVDSLRQTLKIYNIDN